MKHIFLFLLLACPAWLMAQEPRKWILGVSFSPEYSFRTLNENPKWADASTQTVIDTRNRYERPKFGFSAGLGAVYTLSSHLLLGTGLFYTDKGEQYIWQKATTSQPEPNMFDSFTLVLHYHSLEVPLTASYKFGKGKWQPVVSGGVSCGVFLYEGHVTNAYAAGKQLTGRAVFSNHTNGLPYRYSLLNVGLLAGFGMEYHPSDTHYFCFEPVYRRSITPVVHNTPVREYLWSFGFNVGYYRNL